MVSNSLIINSVQKAFVVLEKIAKSRGGKTLTEVSRELQMSMGSAQRLTNTLLEIGYLTKDPVTKKLELAPRCLSLALQFMNRTGVRDNAYPSLKELNAETGETVNLAVLGEGEDIVYIERVETSHIITTNIRPGVTRPLFATSIGKAILAFSSEDVQKSILLNLKDNVTFKERYENSADFEEELSRIKEQRYSSNLSQLDRDLFAVAVPILNYSGTAIAGINIVVPDSRASVEKIVKEYVPKLIRQGEIISSKMGYIQNK